MRPQDPSRYTGRIDLPALPPDPLVARRLRAQLPTGCVWLTSPQKRARQSAQLLDGSVQAVEVSDFSDQDLGAWAGQRRNDVHKAHEGLDWSDPVNIVPPGGETFAQVVDRVASGIERLSAHYPDQPLVAVTHAVVVRAAIALALDLPAEEGLRFDIAPASLTHLSWRGPDDLGDGETRAGEWTVHCVNLTVS